jgi:hypothetical protein
MRIADPARPDWRRNLFHGGGSFFQEVLREPADSPGGGD